MAASEYEVVLDLPAGEYLRMYRGEAREVIARDTQGRRIRFPADALRRFVTRDGVHGRFLIRVDEHARLLELRRLDRGVSNSG